MAVCTCLNLLKHADSGCQLIIFSVHLLMTSKKKSIGIILSGMGSDGSMGLKAIKEQNGIVAVQDPSTAKFDSMPQCAVNAVVVDILAPANQLAEN